MAFLNDSERARIADAIREAENRTSGEIVTVIARASDDYAFVPLLWASLLSLAVPLPLLVLDVPLHAVEIYEIQLGLFAVLALLVQWMPVKMRLIPKSVKRRRAARLAREQFLEQGLHHTEGRTGVLLFVSVAEHHVEVLADSGINDKVAPDTWERLVEALVAQVKGKRVADGFLEAVNTCGTVLAQHFPKAPGDKNELPDHLVEI